MIWELSVWTLVMFNFLFGLGFGLLKDFPVDFFHDGDFFFRSKLELHLFVDDGPDKVFENFFTGLFLNRVLMGDKVFFQKVSHWSDYNLFIYKFNFWVSVFKALKSNTSQR